MIIDDPRNKTLVKTPENENLKIWRYIDLPKFISLLNKKLFFVQACYLPDIYEGFWLKTNTHLDEYLKELKQYTCISCWQKNESESALMWKVYPGSNNGIAIQSTFKSLWQSFDDEKRNLYVFKVHYTNKILKSKPKNTFKPFFRKRKYFKDEHEIRLVYQEIDKGIQQGSTIDFVNHGASIIVNLDKLIEEIYISPNAEKWFINLVQSIVNKYGLNIQVKPSVLGEVPADFKDKDTSNKIVVLDNNSDGKGVYLVPYGAISDQSGNCKGINGEDYITMQAKII